jgi:hypothetical protein
VTTPEDAEERSDSIAKPLTVEVRGSVDLRVSIRSYSSGHLLWTAQHEAELAGLVEAGLAGTVPFSLEHRGYVLSSIIASVAFLEAMINELFQDAADGHAPEPDGYITPLSEECRRTMADVWAITRGAVYPPSRSSTPSCGASALLCSTERATWSRTPKPRLTCGIDLSTFDPRIGPQRTRLTRWSASVGSSPITPSGLAPGTRGGRTRRSITEPRIGRIARSSRLPITFRMRWGLCRTTGGWRPPDGNRRLGCERADGGGPASDDGLAVRRGLPARANAPGWIARARGDDRTSRLGALLEVGGHLSHLLERIDGPERPPLLGVTDRVLRVSHPRVN